MTSERKSNVTVSDPDRVDVPGQPGGRDPQAMSRAVINPSLGGAVTIKAFSKKYRDGLTFVELTHSLSEQVKAVQGGDLERSEAMLTVQAHTLDAIFNEMAQRAASNMGEHLHATDTYVRLALKAQSQCRATLETLAAINNPPAVFARQTNIAHGPQQVNNHDTAPARVSAAENRSEQSKLSGDDHQLLPDTRAPGFTSGINPALETVGEIHRAEVGRG